MKRIKLFEDFDEEQNGFISVPPDFEKRLKDFEEDAKQKREVYSVPKNQIKIDLFVGLKFAIRDFIDYYNDSRTQEDYQRILNNEIDGILYNFSVGKYNNIPEDKVELVKDMLWKEIDKTIPYDEVDYYYTYDLRGKLMQLLDNFVNRIVEKGIFN